MFHRSHVWNWGWHHDISRATIFLIILVFWTHFCGQSKYDNKVFKVLCWVHCQWVVLAEHWASHSEAGLATGGTRGHASTQDHGAGPARSMQQDGEGVREKVGNMWGSEKGGLPAIHVMDRPLQLNAVRMRNINVSVRHVCTQVIWKQHVFYLLVQLWRKMSISKIIDEKQSALTL